VLLEGGLGLLGSLAGALLGLLEELDKLLIAGLLGVLDVLLGVGGGLEGMIIDADEVVERIGRAGRLLAVAHGGGLLAAEGGTGGGAPLV